MTTRNTSNHTFRDLIEHLVDFGGGIEPEREERPVRRAILQAYRKLPMDWDWRYFKDDKRINLEANYDTGTIEYTYTGGLYERMFDLSDGTWPTNAARGRIEISNVQYKVQDRKSSSIVTASPDLCPVADIDAGTSYDWYRTEYALDNVHRIWEMNDEAGYWKATYIPPADWLARERTYRTSGRPFCWTLTGGRDFFGGYGIRTSGYPTEASTMDFICTVKPRRLVIDGIASTWTSSSSVTCTAASGTTCTISGATFNAEVVGAIIRFSRNSSVPTDVEGGNPYIDQRIITAVDDAGTTLTLDDTLDFGGASVSTGFVISDPVDLPDELYDLLLAWAEYEYAKTRVRDRLKEATGAWYAARRMARAWDNNVELPTLTHPWSVEDWVSPLATLTSVTDYDGDPL